MKKIFKFSGIVTPTDRDSDWEFEGYFVKQEENNEIIGINRDIVGNSFIKGLFIDNQNLIFVEISEEDEKKIANGVNFEAERKAYLSLIGSL